MDTGILPYSYNGAIYLLLGQERNNLWQILEDHQIKMKNHIKQQ